MPTLTAVPDLIGPIVAYRMWGYSIDRRGLHLGAVNDGSWDGAGRGWVAASCRWMRLGDAHTAPKLPHRAPNEHCTCGFYAVKTILDAGSLIVTALVARRNAAFGSDGDREDGRSFGCVFGRVELAGKVIEHRLGYRAERARVLELMPLGQGDQVTSSVAVGLGVPTAEPLEDLPDDHALDALEAVVLTPGGRRRPPNPVERLRLRTHLRLFRVIQGGAAPGSSSS